MNSSKYIEEIRSLVDNSRMKINKKRSRKISTSCTYFKVDLSLLRRAICVNT